MRTLILWGLVFGCCLAQAADEFVYTVRPGDNPWNIGQRYLKNPADALRLAKLNRIPDTHRMRPGTSLRIPTRWLRLQPLGARLVAVNGEVRIVSDAGVARAAGVGDLVPMGSVLRSGAQSTAKIEFDDGSRVLVRQLTELRLVRTQWRVLADSSLVELNLLRGALENAIRPQDRAASRFEISSPAAVASVRGTEFRVSADGQQTWTEVLEGAVAVANPAGQTDAVAGTGSFTQAGRPPGPPVRLLAAPDLAALPARLERLPLDWPLPPVAGAVRYRTQISPDARFDVIVSDEVAVQPRARSLDIADSSYVLRVRAIDVNGLEGLSAERALEVWARPEPPLLLDPAPDAVLVDARPTFRWTRANPAWHYRLQIFAGADPAAPPYDEQVLALASAQPRIDLDSGIYRWRVAAIDPARARQGPWGDSQGLRRVLPGPGVEPPKLEPGAVTLRWSAQPHTRAYGLQVAREPGFGELLLDTQTTQAQHRLEQLKPGPHHVRTRSIGEDGYTGPWGAAQVFTVPPEPEPSHDKAWLLLIPLLFGL